MHIVSVVESGWSEVNALDLVLDDILGINGQLERLRL